VGRQFITETVHRIYTKRTQTSDVYRRTMENIEEPLIRTYPDGFYQDAIYKIDADHAGNGNEE